MSQQVAPIRFHIHLRLLPSEDLTITGDVTSKGERRIDGRVQGNVHCLSLILGENSEIKGDVKAEEVLIRGRLIGSVRAVG
jgi:cytoskeletal protein CcmA (bactofilin family)